MACIINKKGGNKMRYCEKASILKSLSDLPFYQDMIYVANMDLEEIVLGVRSGNLFYSILKTSDGKKIEEEEWWMFLDRINDFKDYLNSQGYIRHDMDAIMMPERYFAETYAVPLGLVDKKVCQPYFYSNDVYETYTFEWNRLRLIRNILYDELTDEQYTAIEKDIMNADRYIYDGNKEALAEARKYLKENRRRLEQRFKVCWL